MMRAAFLLLLISTTAVAQTALPARIETAVHVGLATYDIVQTCQHLGPHWHEDFLPSQHCGPIAGMIAGQVGAEELFARQLGKHNHHRLAHVVRFLGISDSAIAVTYSWRNR